MLFLEQELVAIVQEMQEQLSLEPPELEQEKTGSGALSSGRGTVGLMFWPSSTVPEGGTKGDLTITDIKPDSNAAASGVKVKRK